MSPNILQLSSCLACPPPTPRFFIFRPSSQHITKSCIMPGQINGETGHAVPSHPHHIEVIEDESRSEKGDNQPSPGLRDSKGWDGKLRIDRNALLQNPEALSDPEYSDEDHVVPGQEIDADEDLLDDEDPDTDDISLAHSRIASIPALRLERFKKVARLCLRQNLVQHIEGLSSLGPTLEELDLYDNLISHVRGLDDLTNLNTLDLSFNKIKHIKHIDHLTELTDLFFVSNKITTIDGLSTLTKLRQLELGSNRIREIKNLDALKNLEELWLAKNKITELKGLAGLPKLRLLSIQSNRIKDLTPLREAPQLEELYISHNALESIAGLDGNPNLTIIDISNNAIKSLKGLSNLKNIEEVWASYNQLSDFADIERELADKENLTTVYFEGNPVQLRQPALYRNKVRLALPQVQQIDATFVKTV
ncbi:protein phosphatases PP1 regulatory subunit sds22 [Hypoxylon trugodes]|uniref:protein phosphatases PP1 regulatory subunit sds22 n=1 Tax=Hypoxylon trugodes TaxID=326681 RepID=UPI002191E55C|nr:protein phosphatases PP1 regulatory subunit sds22 [Hypoxylon trugodes]KAI1392677.1 protein phosphatases PP1 regulatory subunit sds22 [Hypoxylon trugodes]